MKNKGVEIQLKDISSTDKFCGINRKYTKSYCIEQGQELYLLPLKIISPILKSVS